MNMWDVILFDLDGTITDPKDGITKSVAYALERVGIKIENPDILTNFIGPPLLESFQKFYSLSEEQSLEAVDLYRQRYSSVGWVENLPYPGIDECLQRLRTAGKTLIIATSKAELYAIKILEYFGLSKYFHAICGTPMDGLKQTKADVIRTALSRIDVFDLSKVVMVGDRMHDILGAHEVGLSAIGVLYGYGDRQEHEAQNADYIVESVEELKSLLLDLRREKHGKL